MAVEGHKRFRKRGGAKKKKNNSKQQRPPEGKDFSENLRTLTDNGNAGEQQLKYFSGFAPGFTSHTSWQTKLGPDLQSYLEKLQVELEQVDPGAEAAFAYAPSDDDPPQSVILSRNALTELSPRLAELSRDNNAARFIEVLLRSSKSAEILSKALDALLETGASRVADLAAHRCASHVLETLLTCVRETGANMEALNTIVSSWSADEIVSIISDPSGSHVFRAIIAALSGLPTDEPREAKLDDSNPRKILSYLDNREPVSEESLHAVVKVATTLLGLKTDVHDMLWQSCSSAALQSLLSALTVTDLPTAEKLGKECLKAGFSDLVNDSSGSRFVERLILCLGSSVVANDINGRLADLAKHPKGNFTVQRYLLGLKGRGAVMSAWDELEKLVPTMLGLGKVRDGVVLALLRVTETQGDENCRRRANRAVARACGAIGAKAKGLAGTLAMGSEELWEKWKQGVKDLGLTGLGIYGRPGDVLRVRAHLVKASLLGTLIARCMMRFSGGPGQATRDSMAALTNTELLAMIADPCLSRLVEQWIQDERIERSMKISSRLFTAIWESGEAAALLAVARSPYGAMVVVRCSSLLRGAQRKQVMEALASDFDNLKNHETGQMVTRKCRLAHYMRKGDQWEQEESTRQTRQRLFAEILEDERNLSDVTQRQKKKRKKYIEGGDSKKQRSTLKQDGSPSSDKQGSSGEATLQGSTVNWNGTKDEQSGIRGDEEEDESTLKSVLSAIETVAKPSKKKGQKKKRHKKEAQKT